MSWPTQSPSTDPSAYYQSLTPDQQLANWTQWQNYQQQYAAWHAQYGAEYARQMQAMTSAPAPVVPSPVVPAPTIGYPYSSGQQPPLPPGNPPPLTETPSSVPPLPLVNNCSYNDNKNYGAFITAPYQQQTSSSQLREYQTAPPPQRPSEYLNPNHNNQHISVEPAPLYQQQPPEFQQFGNQSQSYEQNNSRKSFAPPNQSTQIDNNDNNKMGRNRWDTQEENSMLNNKQWSQDHMWKRDEVSNNRNGRFNRGHNVVDKRNNRGNFDAAKNEGKCDRRFDQRGNNQSNANFNRGSMGSQNKPISLMSLNFDRETVSKESASTKNDHHEGGRNYAGTHPMDPNELTEEEKEFEIQFKKWESEFEKWKQQNAKHPDRNAYREYEKRFEECRAKLVARREQMRQKKLERIKLLNVKVEVKEENECYMEEAPMENINEQVEKSTMNIASIFNSNSGFGIPGLDLTAGEIPSREDTSMTHAIKEKTTIDLTNEILNATPSSSIAESITKLIENPEVLTLLSLVGLSKATPTETQTEALKPITDALSKITGRNANDIMDELQKASIDGLKVCPNHQKTSETLISQLRTDSNLHIAQSGIVVAPPTYSSQQNIYPHHNQWDLSWSHQHYNNSSQNQKMSLSATIETSSTEDNDGFFQPATVIDYAKQNSAENFNAVNIVDYQHGEFSFKGDQYFNIKKSFDYGHESTKRRKRNDKPFYGESNPTYPSRWILISERPPLTKRTKRGKRKNRKGKIIESKKNPKNQTQDDDYFKPAKVIDYAMSSENLQKENFNSHKQESCLKTPIKPRTNKNHDKIEATAKKPIPSSESYPPTETLKYHKNVISLDEILLDPGRAARPEKICLIFRGPPGSGKSCLAKIIKDQELAISGNSPRILSIDDYYSIEKEIDEVDPKSGKKTKTNVMVYEFDPFKERTYIGFLLKNYKKTILDGLYNFIIIDTWNDQMKDYEEFHNFAEQHGYIPYTIELLYPLDVCMKHNEHKRLSYDVRTMISNWSKLPSNHTLLDATNLIQFSMSQSEMQASVTEKIETPMDSIEIDLASEQNDDCYVEDVESGYFRSKWEDEATEDKLAKLDGISKPIKKQTIEDYLQMDEWKGSTPPNNGKKMVRWADIEAHREQNRMKAIGFVVGQTDWTRMLDPTKGDNALRKIKYIDKIKK